MARRAIPVLIITSQEWPFGPFLTESPSIHGQAETAWPGWPGRPFRPSWPFRPGLPVTLLIGWALGQEWPELAIPDLLSDTFRCQKALQESAVGGFLKAFPHRFWEVWPERPDWPFRPVWPFWPDWPTSLLIGWAFSTMWPGRPHR